MVFPTETVYGIGANALDAEAVRRIFEAKGRPVDNPLIVHVHRVSDVGPLVDGLPEEAQALFAAFSPGPLTLVLPAAESLSRVVTAGLSTVAVRIPSHPVALALLDRAGCPIAAPSANRSGEPSPTTVQMARRSLGSAVTHYLDGGRCDVGLESTVAAVEPNRVVILRPGAITASRMREVLPDVSVLYAASVTAETDAARSPGMKHRHYQPRARVAVCEVDARSAAGRADGDLDRTFRDVLGMHAGDAGPAAVGVIGSADAVDAVERAVQRTLGSERARVRRRVAASLEEYGRNLYRWFAELDAEGVRLVLAELPRESGIGRALRDRLERASGGLKLQLR